MSPKAAVVGLLAASMLAAALLASAREAEAGALLPERGRIFFGVSDTGSEMTFRAFGHKVRFHPAVLQAFHAWGTPIYRQMDRWDATRTRGSLSISTARGYGGEEVIAPQTIWKGFGDEYPLYLNRAFTRREQTVYIRLLPEMNGSFNPYSAFDYNGTPRDGRHGRRDFKRAWRRFALIVRGGLTRQQLNRRLRRRGMPPLLRATAEDRDEVYGSSEAYGGEPVPRRLPRARVALVWTPLAFGSPNVRGNQPRNYWPGRRFVDWIGTDTYARFRTAFPAVRSFYREWKRARKPFAIGEYSPWNDDYSGRWSRMLFHWVRKHRRVRMLLYYRGFLPDDPHEIQRYPGAHRAHRHELRRWRYQAFAPERRSSR